MSRFLRENSLAARSPGPGDHYDAPMGSDEELEDFEEEFGPLERRLRNMKWMDAEPGLRERCWNEFQRIISKRARAGGTQTEDG